MPGIAATKKREKVEAHAKQYIYTMSPQKYHDFLVPDFPLGCKRRIFDPNYLETLHSPKLTVLPQGIKAIDETGIIEESGAHEKFDLIVLATGFQVHNFLTPMEVIGKHGVSLSQQWKENRGAQAYMGSFVHNFPNMAIL
jgi:cation diffusion facilitator CzcD-associated flavoprotein CzcO